VELTQLEDPMKVARSLAFVTILITGLIRETHRQVEKGQGGVKITDAEAQQDC